VTDNEIKKALECCKATKLHRHCLDFGCPFATEYGCNISSEDLRNEALDLINRQQAEIEKLRAECCNQSVLWNKHFEGIFETAKETIKAEAIKKFADNLCRVFAGHSDYHGDTILTKIICLKEGKPIQTAKPIDTSKIKYAAIKEFAERLKAEMKNSVKILSIDGTCCVIGFDDIDNLVKEMVGDADV
jgi:hypothetical protein